MKAKSLILLFFLIITEIKGQVTTLGNTSASAATDYLGWSSNFPLVSKTFGINRMIIDNGSANQNFGRISVGNNLPLGFVAQDRLHIHTQGVNNLHTYVRFTNPSTGITGTDGFGIGNSNVIPINGPQGDAILEQFEAAPTLMKAANAHSAQVLPYEWFRLQNGAVFTPSVNFVPPRSTDGFVGLNQPNPRSHIEMITPAFNGGEEFLMAKPECKA